MNKIKGFTLFTALVGFIIIGFGMLIIQHMSNSESNYQRTIFALKSQSEMESIKDIVRFEGFNLFNLLTRVKVYEFYNLPENKPTDGTLVELNDSMHCIIEKGQTQLFYGGNCDPRAVNECGLTKLAQNCDAQDNKFSTYFAQNVIFQISSLSGWFRDIYFYRIYDRAQINSQNPINLGNPEESVGTGTASTNDNTKIAFNKARADPNSNITTVLNCTENNCEDGSFFVNAKFTQIPDDKYLDLPRIFVYRGRPQSSLDDSIIPKSDLQFYVPFRIYGAIYAFKSAYENANININDIKSEESTRVNSCDEFSNKNSTQLDVYKTGTDISSDINKQMCDALKSHYLTTNGLELTSCTSNIETYVNKSYQFSNGALPGGLSGVVDYKIKTINLKVSIKDNSENYNFGDRRITFPLNYPINIEQSPQRTEIMCDCEILDQVNGVVGTCKERSRNTVTS